MRAANAPAFLSIESLSQDSTCTGCIEGFHNVVCGPKSKTEAPEINCLPYAEEGNRVLKPSGISALGKACCRKLVLVIGLV